MNKYDQIVKGDVKIIKKENNFYKIIFYKTSEFTLYQVSNNHTERIIFNDTGKKWQENFIAEQKRSGFAPTTIMEINDCKYAFVIKNAYFCKNRLIFEISTKEILNFSNSISKKIKTGFFKNVRFDIDSISSSFNPGFRGGVLTSSQGFGGSIFTPFNI